MPIKWPYIIVLILFLISLCYIFYPRIENLFIFYPQGPFDFHPQDLHMAYREVHFDTSDGQRLYGWFFPAGNHDPVILFFHGNAGNISHRLDNIARLVEQDLQVFIFDFRGYGKSTGRPSEKGLYQDGSAAYEYLVEKEGISPERIILFGRSLGASVAIEIATQKHARSIILESAFTSIKDMARTIALFRLFSWAVPENYHNLVKISRIHIPLLIIHGDQDEIVPFQIGRNLFAAANDPKSFFKLAGAGHNDTYVVGGKEYFRTFAKFAREGSI
ncbi:MAG: alpha/beta hydrolase [Deltaproteobacteria bacterium]|nr:alpha/beta hydrolase [Deltaproteobacteria bacterium]